MNKPRSGASHSSFCATFLCTIRVNSFQQVRFLLAVFYSWEALCTIKHQRYWRSGRICGSTEVTRYYLYCFKLLGDLGVALLLSFNSQRTWLLLIYKMCCSVVMSVSEHKTKVQAESQLQVTRWCSHRAWTASASLGRNQLPQSDLNSRDSSVLNRLTGSGLTRNDVRAISLLNYSVCILILMDVETKKWKRTNAKESDQTFWLLDTWNKHIARDLCCQSGFAVMKSSG